MIVGCRAKMSLNVQLREEGEKVRSAELSPLLGFHAGLMVAGSVIMVNLIVAIIITDVKNLVDTSREQALVNEVPVKSIVV